MILAILIVIIISVSCKKDNNEENYRNNTDDSIQNTSETKKAQTADEIQAEEFSAEKANKILDKLGIKSYDIWSYLRPETGEETDEFLMQEVNKYFPNISLEEKQQRIEQERECIYGRYKVEQENPLIIKVNCKNDEGTAYISETKWQERAYTYYSPNGFLFKDNNKWYEILGYGNYREDSQWSVNEYIWGYSSNNEAKGVYVTANIYAKGYYASDVCNEEKLKEEINYEPSVGGKSEIINRGDYTYLCDDLTINVHYLLEEGPIDDEQGLSRTLWLRLYTMLDENKAVYCNFIIQDKNGYYNEITEDKLRELFTIREYK